jgi:hypothetical protein
MTGCFVVYKLVLDDKSGRAMERVEVKRILGWQKIDFVFKVFS